VRLRSELSPRTPFPHTSTNSRLTSCLAAGVSRVGLRLLRRRWRRRWRDGSLNCGRRDVRCGRTLNCLRRSNGCDRRGRHRRWGRSRWWRRFLRVWRRVRRAGFRVIRTGWWFPRSRAVGPGRRFPRAGVVGPGRRPRLVVMRRRRRFVAFVVRRRLYQRGSRRRRIWHKARAAGTDRRAGSDVIRVEWTANARSGVAPRGRCAFGVARAHRRTGRIGGVIRAFVSHGRSTIGRNGSQDQRSVVHAVGSDRKADQHGSRAGSAGNDGERPGRFPRPPLDRICAYIAWPMRSWDHSLHLC
jgi:hypothetical protein